MAQAMPTVQQLKAELARRATPEGRLAEIIRRREFMSAPENQVECEHGLTRAWCAICLGIDDPDVVDVGNVMGDPSTCSQRWETICCQPYARSW